MDEAREVDCWDRLGNDDYWQPLPPSSLDEAVSGESQSLYVRQDLAGEGPHEAWYVTRGEGERPDGPHPDLASAKRAGDAIIAAAHEDYSRKVVADAGLDPDAWTLSSDFSTVVFTHSGDPSRVVCHDGKSRTWTLIVGDDDAGTYATPALAAAAMPGDAPAP